MMWTPHPWKFKARLNGVLRKVSLPKAGVELDDF